jgi:hypothetical protein
MGAIVRMVRRMLNASPRKKAAVLHELYRIFCKAADLDFLQQLQEEIGTALTDSECDEFVFTPIGFIAAMNYAEKRNGKSERAMEYLQL